MRKLPLTKAQLAALLAAIVAVLAAFGLQLPGGSSPPPKPTPAAAAPRAAAPASLTANVEHNLADSAGERELGTAPTQRVGDSFPGCETRFNTHNFSSRRGAAIRVLAPHYTVSRNVPGMADVNAIVGFLDRAPTQASAHFVIDDEGHCVYTVPIAMKAWTEVAGNPFSVSIEFVALGTEGQLSPAALDQGGRVFAEVAKREHIPVQLGDVTGCQPNRPGAADHAMFGLCGGGHCDLRPMNGTHLCHQASEDARALAPLLAAIRRHMRSVTSVDRLTCRRLNWWRAHGRLGGAHLANAIRRRDALSRRGVRCLASGPVLV